MNWQVMYNGWKLAEFSNGQKLRLKTADSRLVAPIEISPLSLPNWFGDGSDGDMDITESQTWYPTATDTGIKEINAYDFILEAGVNITMGDRNSGLIIRTQGDCTINGNIINRLAPRSHNTGLSEYYPTWMVLNGAGGNGSNGEASILGAYDSSGGAGQTGRYYGGGYGGGGAGSASSLSISGGQGSGSRGGAGGSATGITTSTGIFVGGSGSYVSGSGTRWGAGGAGSYGGGGGAGVAYSSQSSGSASSPAGGSGAGANGGSGSGYAGGSGAAGNYGGGVVIIYCGGVLTINGQILCNGSNGGTGGNKKNGTRVGGNGGGGGGGRIYLMSRGARYLNGTFNVTGGNGAGNGTRYHIDYANFNDGLGTPTTF